MLRFICLEGVDATGKTEVSKCLAEKLNYQYYKSPGNPFSSVRNIVDDDVDPLTRYFFYRAATQSDSQKIARILMSSGVVCDRYIYSTFAFHGAMDVQVQSLFETTQLLVPDYTFVLTARGSVRIERLQSRSDVKDLELNLMLQHEADRLFKTFGHQVVDTSDITVEETTNIILSYMNAKGAKS